jgi:hypothetical protein
MPESSVPAGRDHFGRLRRKKLKRDHRLPDSVLGHNDVLDEVYLPTTLPAVLPPEKAQFT